MGIQLQSRPELLAQVQADLAHHFPGDHTVQLSRELANALLADAAAAHQLHALINNPHTVDFLLATRLEAAHQRDRWGDAHDRKKSAEQWFWLVGYLAGKCLRAVIVGDRQKALHHTISSAAALANWYEAIKRDTTGAGLGDDADLRSLETSEGEAVEARA